MDLTFNAISLSHPLSGTASTSGRKGRLSNKGDKEEADQINAEISGLHGAGLEDEGNLQSSYGAPHVAPVLLTRTVSLSVRFLTSLTSPSHPALSFRSATMYSHVPGPRALMRSDVFFNSDSFRLAMKTLAPFWTKPW